MYGVLIYSECITSRRCLSTLENQEKVKQCTAVDKVSKKIYFIHLKEVYVKKYQYQTTLSDWKTAVIQAKYRSLQTNQTP